VPSGWQGPQLDRHISRDRAGGSPLVGANHRSDTIDKTTPVQQAPRIAAQRGLAGWTAADGALLR
jgi:hypothetical protein